MWSGTLSYVNTKCLCWVERNRAVRKRSSKCAGHRQWWGRYHKAIGVACVDKNLAVDAHMHVCLVNTQRRHAAARLGSTHLELHRHAIAECLSDGLAHGLAASSGLPITLAGE